MSTVHFATARPYRVIIQAGALDRLGDAQTLGEATKVAVFFSATLATLAHRVADLLHTAGVSPVLIQIPDGEQAKTPEIVVDSWTRVANAGLTRSDLIIGLGGGATTDLAGFVAATWLRGISWISVPTTLLAMVDAGIGGKTGADLAQGKNLVGAFWEPRLVLEDPRLLVGLDAAQIRSGLAEVIKHGFIADEASLALIEQNPQSAQDVTNPCLVELIRRSVRVKAAVVSTDLREKTSMSDRLGREQLNYGHTLGHAIEAAEHYRRSHGECVAVGMIFAAELSRKLLGLADASVCRHREILAAVGLPTSYHGAEWSTLYKLMLRDKKTRGALLRFVGLADQGQPRIMANPDSQSLAQAWRALGHDPD